MIHNKSNDPNAMLTPWGKADSQRVVYEAHGSRVWRVSTPGHGGMMMSRRLARRMLSRKAYSIGCEWGDWLTFEEDCEWAAFVYEYPNVYAEFQRREMWPEFVGEHPEYASPSYWQAEAKWVLERWWPEYFG
jgi:hypothetical protein